MHMCVAQRESGVPKHTFQVENLQSNWWVSRNTTASVPLNVNSAWELCYVTRWECIGRLFGLYRYITENAATIVKRKFEEYPTFCFNATVIAIIAILVLKYFQRSPHDVWPTARLVTQIRVRSRNKLILFCRGTSCSKLSGQYTLAFILDFCNK